MENKNYVAPQIEVIEIEIEGVLCASGNVENMQSNGSIGSWSI